MKKLPAKLTKDSKSVYLDSSGSQTSLMRIVVGLAKWHGDGTVRYRPASAHDYKEVEAVEVPAKDFWILLALCELADETVKKMIRKAAKCRKAK